jgi:hypothetical protein
LDFCDSDFQRAPLTGDGRGKRPETVRASARLEIRTLEIKTPEIKTPKILCPLQIRTPGRV